MKLLIHSQTSTVEGHGWVDTSHRKLRMWHWCQSGMILGSHQANGRRRYKVTDNNASAQNHYNDVIMSTMASQITSASIVCSTIYSGADQRKHQSSASLAFVRGIHRSPVNSPHKSLVTRKMFPFDDVTMTERAQKLNE